MFANPYIWQPYLVDGLDMLQKAGASEESQSSFEDAFLAGLMFVAPSIGVHAKGAKDEIGTSKPGRLEPANV